MSDSFTADRFPALLRDLTALPGIAGHEGPVMGYLADRMQESGADRAWCDDIGNLIARFGDEAAPHRIAVLAHMDTVGLMVKRINEDRTLGVVAVGGVNVKALPGAAVRVGDIPGVIGVRSQHLAQPGDSAPDMDALYIQVDPALASQIEITTPVTYAPQTVPLGDRLLCSPYLDNRAGCAVLLALAEWLGKARALLSERRCAVTLIGTVQEETTCAGAMSALRAVAPEYALFVDGTLSYDTPDTRKLGAVKLGGGPVLTAFLYVSGLNGWHADPGLRSHLKRLAIEQGIPFQQDALHGLISDARAAGWLGIPSVLVGLPMRGKHAPLETVHLDDLANAARLLAAALSDPYHLA